MARGDDRENLLKVLISTDNHLGVWERDEVRREDSFRAFEEVLQLATNLEVDFVLLGGDLFHENKPSRSCVVKAIQIFSKYCLNDRPVQFKILSDQASNFVSGRVNYEDPNLNIGLPVLSIHGNHDDPAGQDNLSAVDILSSCGLLNYFGKALIGGSTSMGKVTLSPILLQKGRTKVALYGLGNIRDERLGRMFQTPGCVQWVRPADAPEYPLSDWVTLFTLHQNRVQHGATTKNTVQEAHIPGFVDLCVWGHEHECIPEPEPMKDAETRLSGVGRYVLQPGSSVATSLSEGESKRKHVIMLEVLEEKWRCSKFPLRTVRPFVFETMCLRDEPDVSTDDPETITQAVEKKVQEMLQQVASEYPPADDCPPLLPLLRLKVDYTGFSTINSQRFGQKWVGKIANPHDMLTWHKATAKKAKGEGEPAPEQHYERPEAADQACIEDLIRENLLSDLELLPFDELGQALHEFVEKDEKAALNDCVELILRETQRVAATTAAREGTLGELKDEQELVSVVAECVAKRAAQREVRDVADRAAATELPAVRSVLDADDDVLAMPPPTATAARGGRGAARGRGSRGGRSKPTGRGASDTATQNTLDSYFSAARPATNARTTQATPATPRGRGRGRGGRGRGRGTPATGQEDMDDDIGSDEVLDTPMTTGARSAAGGRTARSTRTTKKMRIESDDDNPVDVISDSDASLSSIDGGKGGAGVSSDSLDDDNDMIEDSPPAKGRGRAAGSQRRQAATPGSARGRPAPPTAAPTPVSGTATGSALHTPGGAGAASFVESDEEEAMRPVARRRVLPGSMASQRTTGSAGPGARNLGATR